MSNLDYFQYLAKRKPKFSTSIVSGSIAIFSATTASVPVDFASIVSSSTTVNNFFYFVNGMSIDTGSVDIQQLGSSFYVYLDTGSLGYGLDSEDEVVVWGRFD